MRDKKGVNFPNKWASLDLVAELIHPCVHDLWGDMSTCFVPASRQSLDFNNYLINLRDVHNV